ncbi:MAG: tetratricopeptide repeat protein [Gemmatimonadota bacterium]
MLGLTGCATRGDVDDLMFEHQRIEQRQDDVQAQMDQLAESVTRLLQAIRADFKADLGALRQEMNAVEAALRGAESQMDELKRYQPRAEPQVMTPADTTDPSRGVDEIGLYNEAVTDYQQGRLNLAREGFIEYLRLFPAGLSASDAQYWVGIIANDQRRFDEAVTELRKVPDRYPESSKAAPALRKIGDAYRAQGDTERGRAAYRELVVRYQNSSEAEAARRELGS